MSFPSAEDSASALRSIEALENELAALQLKLENDDSTATAALRERLSKSEAWAPSNTYVEMFTAAQAVLANKFLPKEIAQAKDPKVYSLNAEVKRLTGALARHTKSQSKPKELKAANIGLTSER